MALRDYLAQRREEIEQQMKALRAELSEIKIAEAALGGAPLNKTVVRSANGPAAIREGSIKDWVLKALMHFSIPMETEQIIDAVQRIGGPAVNRNSMTPQLSRLKGDKLITLEGRLWRLVPPDLAQKDEAPGAGTPDAPDEDADEFDDILGLTPIPARTGA